MDQFLVLSALLVHLLGIDLECLVHFNLQEFFQSLVLFDFKLDVGLFTDHQLALGQLLLVHFKPLLESWSFLHSFVLCAL